MQRWQSDVWCRKLIKLWSLCGPWKEKPTLVSLYESVARR
jgi:hypothetical protein